MKEDYKKQILEILNKVQKPAQYLGNELNVISKNWDNIDLRVVLVFPDLYEIGMSYIGQKILYQIINKFDWALAERCYAPFPDMEELLRSKDIPLFSLESKTPLSDFDLIGFSLVYELNYTTLLNILNLAKIPLLRKERENSSYLICAGGSGAFNPLPLEDFIDFFVIGDGEEVIVEILEIIRQFKINKRFHLSKMNLLQRLSQINGVYVPDITKKKVTKRILKELKKENHPLEFPIPYIEIVHDRVTIEVRRGCDRGCRFCQAGFITRPVRELKKDSVVELIQSSIEKTGYEEYSLFSLSTTDYSDLESLLFSLLESISQYRCSFSLPSLRVDKFSLDIAQFIYNTKKSTLTFAPEAGSQRLRDVINKGITEQDLLETITCAYLAGWSKLKLYFMIGLPTETEQDLVEIALLVDKILKIGNTIYKNRKGNLSSKLKSNLINLKPIELNITISTFVPKPHTPFQWCKQLNIDEIKEKQKFLKDLIKSPRVKLSFHDPFKSVLESIISRGDNTISNFLLKAWEKGAKLDSWDDYFNRDIWDQTIIEMGPKNIIKEYSIEEELPWDIINSGVEKSFLIKEYNKSTKNQLTMRCSIKCSNCGVCKNLNLSKTITQNKISSNKVVLDTDKIINITKSQSISVCRIRSKFHKLGLLRFLSHLDIIRLFERCLKQALLPITFSSGFNPRPQFTIALPTSVGVSSECELIDFWLSEKIDNKVFQCELNQKLPCDLRLIESNEISLKEPAITTIVTQVKYLINLELYEFEELNKTIDYILRSDNLLIRRIKDKKKTRNIELKKFILDLKTNKINRNIQDLIVSLKIINGSTVKPIEILDLIKEISKLEFKINKIHRIFLG